MNGRVTILIFFFLLGAAACIGNGGRASYSKCDTIFRADKCSQYRSINYIAGKPYFEIGISKAKIRVRFKSSEIYFDCTLRSSAEVPETVFLQPNCLYNLVFSPAPAGSLRCLRGPPETCFC